MSGAPYYAGPEAPRSRLLSALMAAAAIAVALALPAVTFGLGYSARGVALHTRATVKAELVNQVIALSPTMWRYQDVRLHDVLTRTPVERPDERATLLAADGTVVSASDNRPGGIAMRRSAPVHDAGVPVGRVEVEQRIDDLLLFTALAAALGAALAGSLFALLRRSQMREAATLATMLDERERARITLFAITDGVVSVDAERRVAYLNPAAAALTLWTPEEARGRPLDEVCPLVDEATMAPAPAAVHTAMDQDRAAAYDEREIALMRRDGTSVAVEDSAAPLHDRTGAVIGAVMVLRDVSATRRMEKRALWDATHDSLTGLVNRREFEARVEAALARARAAAPGGVVCYLDLDQFKLVNDTCGHTAGDALLRQVGGVLQNRLRRSDTLARLGGDEFGVLLEDCPLDRAERIAADLLAAIREFRFVWEGKAFSVGASIGMIALGRDVGSRADVLAAVDAACYAAKEQGRGRICVYRSSDADIARRRSEMGWAARLSRAIEDNRLTLYYQPYKPLGPHSAPGEHMEVLLRLIDEDGNLVAPGTFLPAAERYNLMPAIDRWVIGHVFARYHELVRRFGAPLTCAINLSGTTLGDEGIFDYIRAQASAHAVPPGGICFEITETAAINNMRVATQFMAAVKGLGFSFALDDFGVGTSSLAYLKTLPVDFLKIDGSFVRNIASDPIDRTMTETINRVGHLMGLQTVGEYAADAEIVAALREIGVDFAQGYGVAPPAPLPE